MLSYMSDLFEDATDFSWPSTKATHAMLLCEMERGMVGWSDMDRIDRVGRAHMQKHASGTKSNWSKSNDLSRKRWFCKKYQVGQCTFMKDHEHAGKLHRHVCAFCITQCRMLQYPEKECNLAKKLSAKKKRM